MHFKPRHWKLLVLWAGFLVLDSLTQLAFKMGGNALAAAPEGLGWFVQALTTPIIWAAICGYIAVFCSWIFILKEMELSKAFPLTSLTFITVPLLGWLVFGESIDLMRGISIGIILLGVSLLAWEPT